MKKIILSLLMLTVVSSYAQDAKYVAAMEKVLGELDSAKTTLNIQNANNTLERIATANPTEWLPLYYQSYCNIMLGLRQEENGTKDEFFDRAGELINKADVISPKNSEIYVMRAFVLSMKISVDPATRGRKYGMESSALTSEAIELDKENPRAYFMKGQGVLHTPPAFGGGADKALPFLEDAVAKYKTFKPSSSIMPHWGEARANEALSQCKEKLKDGK